MSDYPKSRKNGGFTLLEIIITVIIVGILAGLALPRFSKTIEFSRANEALAGLSVIRKSMERCYMLESSYANCSDFSTLDVEDPSGIPSAHFSYAITSDATTFLVTATRNTTNGGDGTSTITISETGEKSGTGAFAKIN